MSLSEAGLVFSFFALIMFLLSPAMGSLVSTYFVQFIILFLFEYVSINYTSFINKVSLSIYYQNNDIIIPLY